MRVDVFLRLSGLLKTRTLAGKACDGGFVTANGRRAKPSSDIGPGDIVSMVLPSGKALEIRVEALPEGKSVSRHDRKGLYSVLSGEDGSE